MKLMTYITLAVSLALTGCSGTKNLVTARTDMPETFVPSAYVDSLSIADVAWWEFYTDPTLTRIMKIALENNRDLLKAASRIEQMRELYGVAESKPSAAGGIKRGIFA